MSGEDGASAAAQPASTAAMSAPQCARVVLRVVLRVVPRIVPRVVPRAKRTPATRKDAATREQASGRARTVCSSRNRDTCGSIASASVSPAPSGCCRGRLQVTKLRLDLRSARDAVCSDVHRAGQARGRRRKTLSILGARAPAALVEAPATHGCKQERARPAGSARSTEEHHDDSCRAGGSDARSAITEGHGGCEHARGARIARACTLAGRVRAHHRAQRSSSNG